MSKKQKMTAVVISQEKIAEDIYSMWLKAEPVAAEAVPGQFISMYTNDGAKLLPRPIKRAIHWRSWDRLETVLIWKREKKKKRCFLAAGLVCRRCWSWQSS